MKISNNFPFFGSSTMKSFRWIQEHVNNGRFLRDSQHPPEYSDVKTALQLSFKRQSNLLWQLLGTKNKHKLTRTAPHITQTFFIRKIAGVTVQLTYLNMSCIRSKFCINNPINYSIWLCTSKCERHLMLYL